MVFGIIGAKSVTYEVLGSDGNGTGGGANLEIGELPIGARASFESSINSTSEVSGVIRYPEVKDRVLTKELLYEHEDIHYLHNKYDWQGAVRRRIENHVTSDHFRYRFRRDVSVSLEVAGKFQKAGVGFDFGKNRLNDIMVNFGIEYYPVSLVDEMKQDPVALVDEMKQADKPSQ